MDTTPILLKGGQSTLDPRLDRVRQVDIRSLAYPIRAALPKEAKQYGPRSYTYHLDLRLNQGREGACVGAGLGHDLAARPGVVSGVTMDWCRENVYWPAQRQDEWEGGAFPGANPQYEGTSVLAGFKVVRDLQLIDGFRWALTFDDLVLGVGYWGPAVIGVDWYEGMFAPDADGFIHPVGRISGGHCVCVVAVKIVKAPDGSVDYLRSYFTVQNSWSAGWGVDGRCRITFAELLKLWPGGDFGFGVNRRKATVA